MIYPNFIKTNSTIGITAPSAGMGERFHELDEAINVLKKQGYKIKETASVRKKGTRSNTGKIRAKEIDELVCDKKVDLLMCATGGDFMFEVMPYLNLENIAKNPKWMIGYSDPTNLLYTVTTNLDIATMYGFNAASYCLDCDLDQVNNLNILKGNLVRQKSFTKYLDFIEGHNGKSKPDRPVKWIAKENELNINGRCIGGCLDVIDKLIGTKYDKTTSFIEKYKDDGIVWYFDIFAMSSLNFYLTLLQMKLAGYFKNCKGVLIGRVALPNVEDKKFDYIKAADKALGNIPHILEMDIGHSNPRTTMINGAIINVKYKDNKGSIEFKLK